MSKLRKKSTLAEAVSFAHLMPLTPGASSRAEEDEDKDKSDPDAEDGNEDEDEKKPSGKKAKTARADDQGDDDGEDDGADADDGDGDDEPDAEDGDEDADEKKPAGKRAQKARADEDGDGNDDDKEDGPSARAGAMRERRRCATIFGSRHASGRPDLAAHLAFNTNMSAAEAIGTMKTLVGGEKAGARSARSTLADRMKAESVPNPGQGGSAAPTGPKGLAAAMLAASKKAQGA